MKKCFCALMLALSFTAPIKMLEAQSDKYDSEYLKIVKEYILHEDGSYDYHYRKEIRLLTYFSFQRLFGETFIVYNPEYQELKINEAFTIMADGKKVNVPENAFNEVLPGFARDIPACNNLREMVVTHTGTEIGSVITLDYTIQTQRDFMPFFFGMEEVGESMPVKNLQIIISAPQTVNLSYMMLNSRTAPEIVELSGQRIYTWNFKDVPALSRSGNQDPEQKTNLIFSAAKDMTSAYFLFVNQPAFKDQPDTAVSRRVELITKDKKNDLDIILALQEVVIDEVKQADIPLAVTGYKVRPPAEIWKSANGTSLEKAILLSEMLKIARINACPVATVPNRWYSSDMGNLAVIDGFMVQVNPRETGRIYLSVTQKQSQNLIYDVQDKTMIQLDANIETMRTFKEKPAANLLQMEGKIRLEDGKTVIGEMEMELDGIANPYFRLRKDSSFVKTLLAGDISSGQIKECELSQISELRSKAQMTSTPITIKTDYKDFIYFELPRFKSGFDSWNLVQFTGTGTTPVRLDFILTEKYVYKLSLPSDYALFTPAGDINIKNDIGELKIKISQSGQNVNIERYLEFYHDVITSDKMDEFHDLILAWENVNMRKIVLKKR